MSYEAAIASFSRDETTLAKSFIISPENVAASWYARLPLRSIISWAQLKEKFLVNFQGFLADITREEDFFSCKQYEKETLVDFFQRFLWLKAQALRSWACHTRFYGQGFKFTHIPYGKLIQNNQCLNIIYLLHE
jgi:hypothetical protein